MKRFFLAFLLLFLAAFTGAAFAQPGLGDFAEDSEASFPWPTNAADGSAITRQSDGTVMVLKDCLTTSVAGITNVEDFGGYVGIHTCIIDLSSDAFYSAGSNYAVLIISATIDGVSPVSSVVANFSIENEFNPPTTAGGGGGGNVQVIPAPNGFVITTGDGEVNDEDSTVALDEVVHQITDNGGTLDVYYLFDIGGAFVPESVTLTGRVNSGNDDLDIFVNTGTQASPAWEQRAILEGKGGSGNNSFKYDLFKTDIMTGVDAGKVAFRFQNTGLTGATLSVDQIFCSIESNVGQVGYAGGAIWVGTINGFPGTTKDIHGVADHPVDNWADALSLSAKLGIIRFQIVNGSTITLTGNSDNYTMLGEGWDLALSGQSVSRAFISGANVSGIATGSSKVRFHHCHFDNVTLPPSDNQNCVLEGTFTVGSAGDYFFENCMSGVTAGATPSFDYGSAIAGTTNVNWRDYIGGVEILNMGTAGTDEMSYDCPVGQLVLNANCAGGEMRRAGLHRLTDNSGNVTIIDGFGMTIATDVSERVDVSLIEGIDATDQINTQADLAISDNFTFTGGNVDANVEAINGNAGAAASLKSITDLIGASGTAQGAGANSNQIQLAADEPTTSGIFDPSMILLVGGPGAGQSRRIIEYDGSTKIAVVSRDWKTLPTNATDYIILADPGGMHVNEGLAMSGTSSTIVLNSLSSTIDGIYDNQTIFIVSGTGQDDHGRVLSYVGATQTATMASDWKTIPDTTTGYLMLPVNSFDPANDTVANVDNVGTTTVNVDMRGTDNATTAGGESAPTAGEIATAVWTYTTRTLTASGDGATILNYTITNSVTTLPIGDVKVWITTDEAGDNIIQQQFTDAFGVATFYLDSGTFYVWRQKSGFSFSNPDSEVIP